MTEHPLPDSDPKSASLDDGHARERRVGKGTALVRKVTAFSQGERPVATSLFQAYFTFMGPGRARGHLSDEALKAVAAHESKLVDHAHAKQMALIAVARMSILAAIIGVVIIVALVRDHVDLVKTVFEGVGLIVSHGVIGTGGYFIGKTQRRSGRK